jgi:hypothetical protein
MGCKCRRECGLVVRCQVPQEQLNEYGKRLTARLVD